MSKGSRQPGLAARAEQTMPCRAGCLHHAHCTPKHSSRPAHGRHPPGQAVQAHADLLAAAHPTPGEAGCVWSAAGAHAQRQPAGRAPHVTHERRSSCAARPTSPLPVATHSLLAYGQPLGALLHRQPQAQLLRLALRRQLKGDVHRLLVGVDWREMGEVEGQCERQRAK